MQQKQSKPKGTIIALIIIVIVAFLLYFYYKGSPREDSTSSLESSGILLEGGEDAQVIGTRVLTLLNQINSLKIDANIFNSAVYKSLVDYTITIPEQAVGRVNPFAPIR